MSKAKQNTFLTGYFAALAVGTIGLGYLAYSAWNGATEASDKYNQTRTKLESLQKAKIFPIQENVDAKKKQVNEFTDAVTKLNTELKQYQKPLQALDAAAFQAKVQKLRDGLITDAKNAGVKLPDNFDLGMGMYLSGFAETAAVPKLDAWLEGIHFVVSTLIASGVKELNVLHRPELAFEKKGATPAVDTTAKPKTPAKPAPKPAASAAKAPKEEPSVLDESTVLERFPFSISFTGSSRAVNQTLNALANTSPDKAPFFIDTRVMRLENEQKTGADTSVKIDSKEEQDEATQKPFRRDSVYIFGVEKVQVFLGLELVRFVDPPTAEAPATDTKVTGTKK